jgi:OOP family OmpA-OmpF porin
MLRLPMQILAPARAVEVPGVYQAALIAALVCACATAHAQGVVGTSSAQLIGPNQVVVSGTVPDEATRVAVVSRLRELYGAERVVDQLTLGAVVAPPQWQQYVQKLLSPSIKQVSHGQLTVQGNTVDIKGEVGNEAVRQQLASDMAQSLNPPTPCATACAWPFKSKRWWTRPWPTASSSSSPAAPC